MKRSVLIQLQLLALRVHHLSLHNVLCYTLFWTLAKAGGAACARMQMIPFAGGCGAAASGTECLLLLLLGFAGLFQRSLASKYLHLPGQMTGRESLVSRVSMQPARNAGEDGRAGHHVGLMQHGGFQERDEATGLFWLILDH